MLLHSDQIAQKRNGTCKSIPVSRKLAGIEVSPMSHVNSVPLSFLTIVSLDRDLGLVVASNGLVHRLRVSRRQFANPEIMFRILEHTTGVDLLAGLTREKQTEAHNRWATIAEIQLDYGNRRN
jgi:hypothetical protein